MPYALLLYPPVKLVSIDFKITPIVIKYINVKILQIISITPIYSYAC